jgi:hypothetical protein
MTDDKSEYLTQITFANTDGSGGRQITFGDKSNSNLQVTRWARDRIRHAAAASVTFGCCPSMAARHSN